MHVIIKQVLARFYVLLQIEVRPLSQVKLTAEYKYEVIGSVSDRSDLSDEMAYMCAKLPIYHIMEKEFVYSANEEKRPRKLHPCS